LIAIKGYHWGPETDQFADISQGELFTEIRAMYILPRRKISVVIGNALKILNM